MTNNDVNKRGTVGQLALVAVSLGALALAIDAAVAATATFTATATITSAVTISQNTQLNFGSLVIVQDGTNRPGGVLSTSGAFTTNAQVGTENMIQIGSPTAGQFTIDAQVNAFVPIEVTFPGAITLTATGAPPANGTLTVDAFTLGTPLAGTMAGSTATIAACNTAINDTTGGTCQFLSDGTGVLTFPLGADIIVDDATTSFIDGNYTGSFDLTAIFY